VYKAANNGISIDEVSFVETEPVISNEVKEKIQSLTSKKATVVFTSMNAVDAVTSQLLQKPDWKIYCVGGITKETVRLFYRETETKCFFSAGISGSMNCRKHSK
jgi:uroporphyrinogen-III synthase